MYSVFVSDIHLNPEQPYLLEQFRALLAHHHLQADALYILGDLFEYWLGDDAQTPYQQAVVALLAEYSQDWPIYIMHGNRDFLLGPRFYQQSGTQPLPDPSTIELYGKQITLLHGDSLCTNVLSYRIYRALVRNRVIQRLALLTPASWRQRLALWLRGDDEHDESQARDVSSSCLQRLAASSPNDAIIIHGHSHYPLIEHQRGKPSFHRYVLNAWGREANQLIVQENWQPTLESIAF